MAGLRNRVHGLFNNLLRVRVRKTNIRSPRGGRTPHSSLLPAQKVSYAKVQY